MILLEVLLPCLMEPLKWSKSEFGIENQAKTSTQQCSFQALFQPGPGSAWADLKKVYRTLRSWTGLQEVGPDSKKLDGTPSWIGFSNMFEGFPHIFVVFQALSEHVLCIPPCFQRIFFQVFPGWKKIPKTASKCSKTIPKNIFIFSKIKLPRSEMSAS